MTATEGLRFALALDEPDEDGWIATRRSGEVPTAASLVTPLELVVERLAAP